MHIRGCEPNRVNGAVKRSESWEIASGDPVTFMKETPAADAHLFHDDGTEHLLGVIKVSRIKHKWFHGVSIPIRPKAGCNVWWQLGKA
jgi:hypothetical protein